MKDSIGNRLTAGNMVMWNGAIVAKVVQVVEGGLSMITRNKHDTTPPSITLEIKLLVDMSQAGPGGEANIPSIVRIVDPTVDEALNQMMGGSDAGKGKPQ